MAEAITAAREAIERRIREIEEETTRLKRALAELTERAGGRGARRRGSGLRRSAGRRGRKVAPRGQRREQLLAHLERNPGARPAEIARAMGTTPANVQNVLRKAREDGVVRRRSDGGYELAGSGSSPGGEPGGGQDANAGNGEAGFVDPAGSRSASISAEGDGRNR
jgi:MarR family